MGLFDFRPPSSSDTTDYKAILVYYQRLRPLRMRLNNTLVKRLSREALDTGARKLGILRNGTFVFETEDESSVLMDYCIYDVFHNGCNTVEQYLCDCPPEAGSEEMVCLRAMQHAKYTLLIVQGVEPGIGCHVRDLFTDETRLLVDIGFSASSQRGTMIATRLLDFGEFMTTTGAALPVVQLDDKALEEWHRKISAHPPEDIFDPASLIRACLKRGASTRVRYEDANTGSRFDKKEEFSPAGSSTRSSPSSKKQFAGKPLGNRRCKCGSGKMVKNCCGKNRSPR